MSIITSIETPPSYVDCGAIKAGTVLALAISVVLIPFGNAIGLSFSDLAREETIRTESVIMIGVWTLWVQLMASMAGAYLAGRILRTNAPNTHESELRDGAHGLVVWAASTVLMAIAIAIATALSAIAVHHGVAHPEPKLSEEMIRKLHVIMGFSLAASSVVSAAAAWAIATLAGDHRDSNIDVSRYVSFRRRTTVTQR